MTKNKFEVSVIGKFVDATSPLPKLDHSIDDKKRDIIDHQKQINAILIDHQKQINVILKALECPIGWVFESTVLGDFFTLDLPRTFVYGDPTKTIEFLRNRLDLQSIQLDDRIFDIAERLVANQRWLESLKQMHNVDSSCVKMSSHPEETTIVKTVFLENLLLLLEGKPELSSWADQLRDIIDTS